MKDLVANKQLTEDDDEVRMNPRSSALLQNLLPLKENDPGSFILHCFIGRLDFNNALADLGASISIMLFPYIIEDFRMPVILERPLLATAHAKGTDEDDDDLEGIIDYLEPTLYDEFVDSNDKEYKERKRSLYKIKVLGVEELSKTRGNIATIRAGIMDEIFGNDDNEESYDET
ncbi:hypothetical protein Tco_0664188 [Tanacetum coccineum]